MQAIELGKESNRLVMRRSGPGILVYMRSDNNKAIGKLVIDGSSRFRRSKPPDETGQEGEGEFEFRGPENNVNHASVGSRSGVSIQHPPTTLVPPSRPPIMCPFTRGTSNAIPPQPVDETQEWINEYAAVQAHEERVEEDYDPQKMAEAAAQLLSQMDLTGDEKLQKSKFVAYLRQLAGGRHDEVGRPSETLERASFEEWRQQYEQSVAPVVSEEERTAWNAVMKDWQSYEASGMGYEGFAQREFVYTFMYPQVAQSPFFESANVSKIAEDLRISGRSTRAILAYEAMVQQNPNDAIAWHRLGQLQVENEQDILAIAAFRQVAAIDPTNDMVWLEMAGCLVNEQCRTEAIEALKNYLKSRHPSNLPSNRINPSLAVEECLRCFAQVEEGNDPGVSIALSILHCLSGDNARGASEIQRALALTEDHHGRLVLQNRAGALHANNGEYLAALRIYDDIITTRPEMVRAHYNRGVSLFNGADYAAAINAFTTALQHQLIPGEGSLMRPEIEQGLYHVWDMLRLTCEMAERPELVIAAKARDLTPFL